MVFADLLRVAVSCHMKGNARPYSWMLGTEVFVLDSEDGNSDRSDSTLGDPIIRYSSSDNTTDLPLLPAAMASLISSFAIATRLSLRMAGIVVENMFESLKFSASASLGLTRRALVTAVSSAKMLHLLALRKPDSSNDAITFYSVLDAYTNFGISIIHNSFSLAELLTLTTFHLTSTSIKFSLEVLNDLFRLPKNACRFLMVYLEKPTHLKHWQPRFSSSSKSGKGKMMH